MSERTEAPTPRKISEARAEGQVARSIELNAAAALLVGVWLLKGPGGRLIDELKNLLTSSILAIPQAQPDDGWLRNLLLADLQHVAPGMGMILAGMAVTGVAVTLAQTGFLWASKRIGVHFDRLNPINGFKRLFSKQGLVELVKAIAKLLVIGWVAYSFLRGRAVELLALGQTDFVTAVGNWVEMAAALALRTGAIYLVLALIDYSYQRWNYMRSLRMTKEEVKEDFKRSEGDPMIKGRIRSQARRIARSRMMANVKKADVVITNPVHLAVAIEYQAEKMSAPRVLAKGAHRTAERIVALARENNVPVVQNIPVARALYKTVEIDQEIPPELYAALAEVLAYVYRMKGKRL
jgi:flagellar biosynthetic protein FlhB